eukprot:6040178-Pleurochrysis_carterae.AAC.3
MRAALDDAAQMHADALDCDGVKLAGGGAQMLDAQALAATRTVRPHSFENARPAASMLTCVRLRPCIFKAARARAHKPARTG